MKQWVSMILFLLVIQTGFSQQHRFSYPDAKLDKVLTDMERQFDVKYSYVDSIIAPKFVSIPDKQYTLSELHALIAAQASLKIISIDGHYYSIQAEADEVIEVNQLREILVESFVSKGISKSSQKVIISPQQIEVLPGVTDADILLSLQQLPGVKSPNETATGLYVRGGTSDQNLILWDGIRMYHPGHLFGMISGFNPHVEQTVNYYNKATNPKFGERISSVISIKPTDKIADSLRTEAGLNALNADVYVRTPLVKNKLGVQLSARKSITEWWQSPTFDALAKKVFQNTNFDDFDDSNKFQFGDYSAKLNFNPTSKTQLSLSGIWIDNHLNFSSPTGIALARNQTMNISNQGYSLNWQQQYGSKWSQQLLLYFSSYAFDYEKKQQYSPSRFEAFQKRNRITDSGAEMNLGYEASESLSFETGVQFLGNDISHAFNGKNQNLDIELDQKQLYNVSYVGYGYAKYLFGSWNLQSGVRYNYYNKLKTDSFEPRVFLQRKLTEALYWQLSFERKSQIMSQIRESVANDLSLENYVWVLSDNAQYPIQKGNQYTTGIIYKKQSWLIDVDAYYKTIDGITSLSFGFLHQYDSTLHKGSGFTKGVDVLVQKSGLDWRTWLTYTYQDSKNRYDGLNDNRYFAINSENTHAFSASFSKKWKQFSTALGWFWHSGKPYSVIDNTGNIVSFNSERLPAYHRLDLSFLYHFHQNKSWTGKAGFSIFNLYNQHTVISKEYERQYANVSDFIHSNYVEQEYHSLGITPNVFVRFTF